MRAQTAKHETVEIRDVEVAEVEHRGDRFGATLADGTWVVACKLLLATGVLDGLSILGFEAFYSKSAHGGAMHDQEHAAMQPVRLLTMLSCRTVLSPRPLTFPLWEHLRCGERTSAAWPNGHADPREGRA